VSVRSFSLHSKSLPNTLEKLLKRTGGNREKLPETAVDFLFLVKKYV
jgi:hypothetical protein